LTIQVGSDAADQTFVLLAADAAGEELAHLYEYPTPSSALSGPGMAGDPARRPSPAGRSPDVVAAVGRASAG
jgi:hypothetical protein